MTSIEANCAAVTRFFRFYRNQGVTNMNQTTDYKNKHFSVLGDSISTLEGYSIPEEAAYYEGMRRFESGVFSPADTWWGRVIGELNGKLLVNDSFSGSTVTYDKRYEIPSYASSDERTSHLHRNGVMPDVVMILMGVNDWGYGRRTAPEDPADAEDLTVFSVAYRARLGKLRAAYPKAELWCLTLPVPVWKHGEFPYTFGGRHIEEYCAVIRAAAAEYDCRTVDLYRTAPPFETVDDFHPNAKGMETVARAVLASL